MREERQTSGSAVTGHAGADDPRYQEGSFHLQAGQWQEAIDSFEDVAREHPDDPVVQSALDDARFKASLDGSTRVRGKLVTIRWRAILLPVVILVAIAAVAALGTRFAIPAIQEFLNEGQERQRLGDLEMEAARLLAAGDLDGAEAAHRELLAAMPDHEGAQQALEQIAEVREIESLYSQAVALQEAGEIEEALKLFLDLEGRRPGYRDIGLRMEQIRRQLGSEGLFAEAEAAFAVGRIEEAQALYEQLREQYATYKKDSIASRLSDIYMQRGRALIEQNPPATEGIPVALEYFSTALALDPRSNEAAQEQQLARLFLEGQDRYQDGRWEEVIIQLREVYDLRPLYLNGLVAAMLYDAYIRTGDQLKDAHDYHLAYDRYRAAAALPVPVTTLAQGRIREIIILLTPTPTPLPTSTPVPG